MISKSGKILLALAFMLSVTSCMVPSSKESYIRNFERFVKDVEKNADSFKAGDWKWANARFSKYSVEWYEKFRVDLKMEENVKISSLRVRYLAAKEGSRTGKFIDEHLRKHIDTMGDEMKKYLDENLYKDVEEIKKGAKEIGDSAVKVMEDVLKEIKKNKEK